MNKFPIMKSKGFDYYTSYGLASDFKALIEYAEKNGTLLSPHQRPIDKNHKNKIKRSLIASAEAHENRVPHDVMISVKKEMIVQEDGNLYLLMPQTIQECYDLVEKYNTPLNALIGILDKQHFLEAQNENEENGVGYKMYGITLSVAIDNTAADDVADTMAQNSINKKFPKAVEIRNRYTTNRLSPDEKIIYDIFKTMNETDGYMLKGKISFDSGKNNIAAIMFHATREHKGLYRSDNTSKNLMTALAPYKSKKTRCAAINFMLKSWQIAMSKGQDIVSVTPSSIKFGYIIQTAPLFFEYLTIRNGGKAPRISMDSVKGLEAGWKTAEMIINQSNLSNGWKQFPNLGQNDVATCVEALITVFSSKHIYKESTSGIFEKLKEAGLDDKKAAACIVNPIRDVVECQKQFEANRATSVVKA